MGVNYNPKIITDGLVLCLDAANARSYPGSGTTWFDLSGNGNNGTLTNGPTYSSNNGGVISFDGTNDHIVCGNISSQFTSNITVTAWFNITTSTTDWVRIAGVGGGVGNRTFGLWYNGGDRQLLWQRYGAQDPAIRPSNVLANNTWYHVCATTSGSSHVVYINGVSVGTATATGPWASTTDNLTIGYAGFHTYHNGIISNVALYNKGLIAEEIQQNFNTTRGRYGI